MFEGQINLVGDFNNITEKVKIYNLEISVIQVQDKVDLLNIVYKKESDVFWLTLCIKHDEHQKPFFAIESFNNTVDSQWFKKTTSATEALSILEKELKFSTRCSFEDYFCFNI